MRSVEEGSSALFVFKVQLSASAVSAIFASCVGHRVSGLMTNHAFRRLFLKSRIVAAGLPGERNATWNKGEP
jgi:hypothetical protein